MSAPSPIIKRLFRDQKSVATIAAFTIIGSFLLYHSLAATNPNLKGDLNNDNKVNISDLSILLTSFNKASSANDLNGDGKVTVADLSILLSNYGKTSGGSPTPTPTPPGPTPTPTPPGGNLADPVISRNAPAFASAGTAKSANDADYDSEWSGSGNSWLAYDLSGVAAANRSSVLLVWYSNSTFAYEPSLSYGDESAHDYPGTYTIETNSAPGGGSAPTSGWAVKTTVSSNPYHSRQHVIDMAGANWIRINVSSVAGSGSPKLNMDVYPASIGTADNWIFYGSSTPSEGMSLKTMGNASKTFSQMIAAAKPGKFPVAEDGSISGINTADGLEHFDEWIKIFPGKYVYIGLGANDADECVSGTTFYNNMKSMVDKTIAAGKTPVVPIFNWSKLSTVQSCGQGLVDQINKLYTAYPQIIKGPDFWTYFKSHPELISSDDTHPTEEGMGIYRQMVAETMLSTVYK